MADILRTLKLNFPEDTTRLARVLAMQLTRGDVLLLHGGLGAGKTHFARGIVQARLGAAGLVEDVPSPTYTLVQTYSDGAVEIWHADLYRLTGMDEVEELGLIEAFDTSICLVEWPDRLGGAAPATALNCAFEMTSKPGQRLLTLTSQSPRWNSLVLES